MEQINWSTEWLTSLLWIGGVFVFTLVGFALVGWLLIRRTRLGPTVLAAVAHVLHPAPAQLDHAGARS